MPPPWPAIYDKQGREIQRRPDWPYYTIGDFYRHHFGQKVMKIPISIAEDCPNRRGLRGMETCIFCDEWGSAAYPEERHRELKEQVDLHREKIRGLHKANKFLVYFQAYTNTFTRLQDLKDRMQAAIECQDVHGLVLGTRPDCLSKGVLRTWKEFNEKTFVSVEIGVQSFFDDQLEYMKRGHGAQLSIEAIHKIKAESGVDLGIHLMFGWPDETDEQIIESAKITSALPVDNVKLHNLHVLKNTELEKYYRAGEFEPIDLDLYAHRVKIFLQHLRPDIAVHRLTAVSSRWEELIAPEWVKQKSAPVQFIIDRMRGDGAYQGQFCKI